MSAHRRRQARRVLSRPEPAGNVDLWFRAVRLRTEWLGHALSAAPADRAATEQAITGLYARLGRPRPGFHWVDSPAAATRALPPAADLLVNESMTLAGQLAGQLSDLRRRLDPGAGDRPPPWVRAAQPPSDPVTRLTSGQRIQAVLDDEVRLALGRTVRDSVAGLVKSAIPERLGLFWYGQQEADWIAHHDILRVLGLARLTTEDSAQLDLWATLARSGGWWWPREDTCVVAERPCLLRTERVPGAEEHERRPHHGDGPAVVFPDGWGVHAWHGTRVPSWVIDGPTPELIAAETNAEVRRCAVERIGWPAFIDRAGLTLVSQAPDPGNPGCTLRLYDLPYRNRGAAVRLLLATNGSPERDGTRRRYGLHVPHWLDDPVNAAGWSYGLTGTQYARLQRRT